MTCRNKISAGKHDNGSGRILGKDPAKDQFSHQHLQSLKIFETLYLKIRLYCNFFLKYLKKRELSPHGNCNKAVFIRFK